MSYFYVLFANGGGYWCEGVAFLNAGGGTSGGGTLHERLLCYENESRIKSMRPNTDTATKDVQSVQLCFDPKRNWLREGDPAARLQAMGTVSTGTAVRSAPPTSAANEEALLHAYQKQVDDECDAIIAGMTRAHMMRVYHKLNAGHRITLNGPHGSLMTDYRIELKKQLAARKPPTP